jgi:HAMP domain-containing protein
MTRVFNFSAGPAALPETVLRQAAAEMLDWHGSGMSVMEMSHRGKEFISIAAEAEALLRELLAVPANYKVLFMQGGAIAENAIVPMNMLRGHASADYIDTGEWSKKSIKEAKKYGKVNVAASAADSGYTTIPARSTWKLDPKPPTCTSAATRPSAASNTTSRPRRAACRWWPTCPVRSCQNYEHADARYQKLLKVGLIGMAVGILLALWFAWMLVRDIVKPLQRTITHFDAIAQGNYSNHIQIDRQDEIGQVLEALESMQTKLGFDMEESRRTANESLRIKTALDSSTVGITVSDADARLVHMTPSARGLLQNLGGSGLNVDTLFGAKLSSVFSDPAAAARFDQAVHSGDVVDMLFNGRHLRLIARPIHGCLPASNSDGSRNGPTAPPKLPWNTK